MEHKKKYNKFKLTIFYISTIITITSLFLFINAVILNALDVIHLTNLINNRDVNGLIIEDLNSRYIPEINGKIFMSICFYVGLIFSFLGCILLKKCSEIDIENRYKIKQYVKYYYLIFDLTIILFGFFIVVFGL